MEDIIAPVEKSRLKAELTIDKKLRDTNKGHNEIYIVTWQDSPDTVREIGRLREIAFRNSGGGSGKEIDLDFFDTMDKPYKQLLVWDPEAEQILGGYRYILGSDVELDEHGQPIMATSHMFHFSDKFISEYLPCTIELGRSFVAPEYQSSKAGAKALYALDNLWDGLGAVMFLKPGMKYFFGKMTMYPSFPKDGRNLILRFLDKHFGDKEKLVVPYHPLDTGTDMSTLDAILCEDDFKADYKIMNAEIRKLGVNIPPLVNAYMSLSSTIKIFGTAINDEFSDVEETGILVSFDEMYEDKKARHVESFLKQKIEKIKDRFPKIEGSIISELAARFKLRRKKLQDKIAARRSRRS